MGENPEVEVENQPVFRPDEFIQQLDDAFSSVFGDRIGSGVGMVYAGLTVFLYVALSYGIFYVLTGLSLSFSERVNIALFPITIGSILLVGGSSLADNFDRKDMNYNSFISTSIHFVGSGILLLTAASFWAVSQSISSPLFLTITNTLQYSLHFLSAIIVSSAIWTFLKLLWRLHQLVGVPESDRTYEMKEYVGGGLLRSFIYPFGILAPFMAWLEIVRYYSLFHGFLLAGAVFTIPWIYQVLYAISSIERFKQTLRQIWKSRYSVIGIIMFSIILVLVLNKYDHIFTDSAAICSLSE